MGILSCLLVNGQQHWAFFNQKPSDFNLNESRLELLDSLALYHKKSDFYKKAIQNNTPFFKWEQFRIHDSLVIVFPSELMKMPALELQPDSAYQFWQMYARLGNPIATDYTLKTQKMLEYLENNGYPFASIQLDHLNWKRDTLQAVVTLSAGPFVSIDSIVIKGESKLLNGAMVHQLGLKKGVPYGESLIKKLQSDINALPYVNSVRAPAMLFSKEKNILYLYLEPQKASAFNALVGVNTSNTGQVQLTGEAEMNLLNAFKKAERIYVQWRGPAPGQQNLEARFSYPFLFGSPLGLQLGLSMFLQDSSFFNINNTVGLRYQLGLNSSIGAAWQGQSSGLLDAATATQQGFSNVSANYLKLDYQWARVNDFFVPSKGVVWEASVANGRNTTGDNTFNRIKTQASVEIFRPIYKQQKFYYKAQFFYLAGNQLAINEAERTGGFKSIRGFNELSFFSNAHLINNIEYRFFLEQYSFINLFYDIGWLQIAQNEGVTTPLMSLGAGFNLNTPQGLFTVLYAIGNSNYEGFMFNNSRVHIGFTNRF